MAEKDDPDGPSLELPSLGFRRKRRAKRDRPAAPEPAAPAAPPVPEPTMTRTEPVPAVQPDHEDEQREPVRRGRPRPTLPQLGPVTAALLTGLLVGVVTVGLVWASQGLCEVVRGTSTCGDAGFLLLLAVLVAAGLVGGSLLTAFGVSDGGSTSFLAMGLVAVVLMLVLSDQLFAWWMVIVVPAVAAVAYVLAHRVTTAMVEPGGPELHR
jgi:hypothetical protein